MFCSVLHLFLFLFVCFSCSLEEWENNQTTHLFGSHLLYLGKSGHWAFWASTLTDWTELDESQVLLLSNKDWKKKLELVEIDEVVKSNLKLGSHSLPPYFVLFWFDPGVDLFPSSQWLAHFAARTNSEQTLEGTLQLLSMGRWPHCCCLTHSLLQCISLSLTAWWRRDLLNATIHWMSLGRSDLRAVELFGEEQVAVREGEKYEAEMKKDVEI